MDIVSVFLLVALVALYLVLPERLKVPAAAVILVCAAVGAGGMWLAKAAEVDSVAVAIERCEGKLREDAHNPERLEFLGWETEEDGDQVKVSGEIRAENGFGALRKMPIVCNVTDDAVELESAEAI